MQTRNCKSVSLIEGVNKLIRSTIADKAKFKLAVAGKLVSKGPTVQDRQTRVEKAQHKVMVNVVESLEEMISLNGSQDLSNNSDQDQVLKEKALHDFKSKKSDTHRPDKTRKSPAVSAEPSKEVIECRKVIKKEGFKVVNKVDAELDITVVVTNSLGQENIVTFSKSDVSCTCEKDSSAVLCAHVVFLLDLMKEEVHGEKI